MSQQAGLVCHKAFNNRFVLFNGKICHITLGSAHVLAKQVPQNNGVLRSHHQAETIIFVGITHRFSSVISKQSINHQAYKGCLNDNAAIVHEQTNQGRGNKRYACCDEPTTNHRYDTRDTEHCTLPTPCTIGKTGTHGNHESDVGC